MLFGGRSVLCFFFFCSFSSRQLNEELSHRCEHFQSDYSSMQKEKVYLKFLNIIVWSCPFGRFENIPFLFASFQMFSLSLLLLFFLLHYPPLNACV